MSVLQMQALSSLRDDQAVHSPVSASFGAGDCVEITGANGAGKTTLLRTLAGLHQQYDGAFVCSEPLYQGHRLGLDELLNPLDNLRWYGGLSGNLPTQQQLQDALAGVDMLALGMTPVAQLSQGQQRRITMARWTLSPSRIWLLDEPVTALDQAGQGLLISLIEQHCASGGCVAYTTHQPLPIERKQGLAVQGLSHTLLRRASA